MKILQYKDFVFADHGYYVALTDEASRGNWAIVPSITERRNMSGEITGVSVSDRPITTTIGYDGSTGMTVEESLDYLLGQLNPLDTEPGWLVAQLNDLDGGGDPIIIGCNALITLPGGKVNGEINTVEVTWLTVDPVWRVPNPVVVGPSNVLAANYGGLTLDVGGAAPTQLQVRLTPTNDESEISIQSFTITNNGTRTVSNLPVRIDFGDMTGFGFPVEIYYSVLLDGVPQRSERVNWGGKQAYLWIVAPRIIPGQTLQYHVLESTDYALITPAFNSYTQPAFDYSWEKNTTTSGSTTTQLKRTGAAWEVNKWAGGRLRILTGVLAGQEKLITSSTADTIVTSAFGTAPATGVDYLITMSANGKWVYPVRQTERNDNQRGLWWLNQGQKKPSDWRFNVPGGWYPYLFYENTDKYNQARWTPVNVGTVDYFAIGDMDRTHEFGPKLQEEGGADGISINMPFPITSLRFDHAFKNPNGMCTFIVGSREGGADSFITEYANAAAAASLAAGAVAVQTLTVTAGTTQLYLGVVPTTVGGEIMEEIDPLWAGDTGTASSGSTTQLNDTTKEWISGQFAGATLSLISGTGAPQTRSLTTNGVDSLTPSSNFSPAPDNTTKYRIKQKSLVSTARTATTFELSWDATNLVISTPTAKAPGYVLDRELFIDRETALTDPPYQRVRFSRPYTGRHLVLLDGQSLVIDGEQVRAWIEDGAGSEVATVPPRSLIVHNIEADGTERLAERWLWLNKPGEHHVVLSALTGGNDYDVEAEFYPGYYG